jgi:predicted RNA binding protein YcfA (HicA-like mRNA interferase family)
MSRIEVHLGGRKMRSRRGNVDWEVLVGLFVLTMIVIGNANSNDSIWEPHFTCQILPQILASVWPHNSPGRQVLAPFHGLESVNSEMLRDLLKLSDNQSSGAGRQIWFSALQITSSQRRTWWIGMWTGSKVHQSFIHPTNHSSVLPRKSSRSLTAELAVGLQN